MGVDRRACGGGGGRPMNGRGVYAAWGVEAAAPLFPDVPAAAAISPDPCARCSAWPPVDGTNYPYFGTLYNNSLPPTAYRLQSGCMPSLLWPPTPPPDGCGRFDGSNMYFGHPVLRSTETVSTNIRTPYQNLGHYSHVIDSPKESSQRVFKRETTTSPNVSSSNISCSVSKSDSFKSCCSIDTKLKSSSSFAYSLPKQELLTVTSNHEPYSCVQETRTSSSFHPSTDKSCFSPSYGAKNSMYLLNTPQDASSKIRPQLGQLAENTSPHKNVYFSNFESEHVNTAQSNKRFNSSEASFEHKSGGRTRQMFMSQSSQPESHPYKKYDYQSVKEYSEASHRTDKQDGVVVIKEHLKRRSHLYSLKAEKVSHSDCKYQKTSSRATAVGPDFKNSAIFNNPTSVMQPKVEPSDRYFAPSSSSTYLGYGTSHVTSSSFLRSNDFTDSYQAGIYPSPDRSWQYSEVPSMSPKNFFKTPPEQTFFMAPPHEGLISVAQTAPLDIDVQRPTNMMLQRTSMSTSSVVEGDKNSDDDEVQIIGVQTKHPTSKSSQKHIKENCQTSGVSTTLPLLKEVKKEIPLKDIEPTSFSEEANVKEPQKPGVHKHLISVCESSVKNSQQLNTTSTSTLLSITKIENDSNEQSVPLTIKIKEPNDSTLTNLKSSSTESQIVKTEEFLDMPKSVISTESCTKPFQCDKNFNENHGLNLLVNTIEKVTFQEQSNCEKKADAIPDLYKIRGLDLLSAIAGERLVSEFEMKVETENVEKVESNYPDVKEEKCVNESKQRPEKTFTPDESSSVFKIKRLAELQKKYKQKQKELSRLKPKKRLANSYLKEQPNTCQNNSLTSSSCSSIQKEVCLSEGSDSSMPNEKDPSMPKLERIDDVVKAKEKCKQPKLSSSDYQRKTRNGYKKSKLKIKSFVITKKSKVAKRVIKIRTCKEKQVSCVSSSIAQKSLSRSLLSAEESPEKLHSLPDCKKSKIYSLRHSSFRRDKKISHLDLDIALNCSMSKKRKSGNPKKYIPSKQIKLSETIVAKHLRNRILFDTSGATSDEENVKDGVPDELYDALIKCHLDEEKNIVSNSEDAAMAAEHSIAYPAPSALKPEHLSERQRLLALEDNLFYAGYIKECQNQNRYGIALDGQRGNRLHVFTREELLTQAVIESKPLSCDLPEGTRVCAFWSQQYRCMYPGFVGKAPGPSADWSEPRVFVLFDDGDSGQIPIKNVRVIPTDIIPADYELRLQQVGGRSSKSKLRGQAPRRLKHSTQKTAKVTFNDTSNENDSKESSCVSLNESSCDDSCFTEYAQSQDSLSHISSSLESITASCSNSIAAENGSKSLKRQKKHSKHKAAHHLSSTENAEAKTKRHKKYKERHHRHHHHRHRHHHHHHHHHHHSKKHKHRRKGNGKSASPLAEEKCVSCEIDLGSQREPAPVNDTTDHSQCKSTST